MYIRRALAQGVSDNQNELCVSICFGFYQKNIKKKHPEMNSEMVDSKDRIQKWTQK